jgi:hypothetical protein
MPASQLFPDFIAFGRRVMVGIDRQESASIRYKRLLGEITRLLRDTHGMVVRRLERIESAQDLDSARSILDELRAQPLEAAFRAEGLCDAFAGLGQTLDRLNWRTEQESDGAFSDGDLAASRGLAAIMVEREGEVALGYTEAIQELVHGVEHAGGLDELQGEAGKARQVLTDQMADFQQLSDRFRRLNEG